MKMRLQLFLVVSALICAAGKPLSKATARNKLLLISFDGFRWDYDQDVDTPNLDQLVSTKTFSVNSTWISFVLRYFELDVFGLSAHFIRTKHQI
ncbi:Ectonucleotide pyrophosphatase/phosphodiesterase family member 7 [Collichthys lucidus]|uniref:Ectonucleotide pyrophosphatase/phosphodiesterase family member 7 n=1 Tax=Collichthys lucidus TaxID=240159 RepID=A0A4U5V605_COLLU|nr:Ectonucleotide pyrophosphatase/phosphodiesterase family member 7 [Collichthys lucidus]